MSEDKIRTIYFYKSYFKDFLNGLKSTKVKEKRAKKHRERKLIEHCK